MGAVNSLAYTGPVYTGNVISRRQVGFNMPALPVYTYRRDPALSHRSLKQVALSYAPFIKEAAKLGVVVGCSLAGEMAGGLPGAMIAGMVSSMGLSVGDQWWVRRQVNWQQVAVEGVTGLVPAGAGRMVHEAMHFLVGKTGYKIPQNFLTRVLGQSLMGATDGAAMGYASGAVSSGFYDYRTQGRISLKHMNQNALKTAEYGVVGGGILGGVLGGFAPLRLL